MNNDLISREALKKSIEQGEGFSWDNYGKDDLCVRKKYIDNAPTVERPQVNVIPQECIKVLAETVADVVQQIDWKALCEKVAERPHGEWKLYDTEQFCYCSNCEDTYYPRPLDPSWYYSPHCGAKMEVSNDG